MTEHSHETQQHANPVNQQQTLWPAPTALHPLHATVSIPGSKSLSNRYLILAALSSQPITIHGLLRSRDTNLMIEALQQLGVRIEQESASSTTVRIIPPKFGNHQQTTGTLESRNGLHPRFHGNTTIFCGLAGTVMRFLPALALFADGPISFDGDSQAYARPMQPLLDGLKQLGAKIEYTGKPGFLPFIVTAPDKPSEHKVRIDSSSSSQFISGLLLAASCLPDGLKLQHTGATLPSLPHIRMTMTDIVNAGGHVSFDAQTNTWTVSPAKLKLPETVTVEPDLSNAAPFLGAALLATGTVQVPFWPETTTQPGGLLPDFLSRMGATVDFPEAAGIRYCRVVSHGDIHGLGDFDLEAAGELAPSLAALLTFADSKTTMLGIAHLRGHETNRLAAMVAEIRRVGGDAEEVEDGIIIRPVEPQRLHNAVIRSYHDHRMATFGAMLGLRISGTQVENIETTRKTLPDFVGMWENMLSCDSADTISDSVHYRS
ncbi:3-phosphoshikimate 1-carboxyvinyltransferase [Bifidobacterium aquikefiricola]|uniref:3-phosphoshikimate 1-carboxyvinyltransferase n=1 Tax=Bifidobacterium aquikefiricola TaxID=3059038 RepID=A0AB39U8J7_9BIFI